MATAHHFSEKSLAVMTNRLSWLLILAITLMGCSLTAADPAPDSVALEPQPHSPTGQVLPIQAKVAIANETIELEIAKTPEQQARGLMFRDALPPNRGMLFPFSPPRFARFWMYNVKIPLDMVFVRDGSVLFIASNVPPCTKLPCPSYGPDREIDRVIELAGGRAEQLGLRVGDRLNIEYLDDR